MFKAFELKILSFYLVFLFFKEILSARRTPLASVLKAGEKADKNEFPFIVLITNDPSNSTDSEYCIGTILDEQWVLTAVDCVLDTTEYVSGKIYHKSVTVLPNDNGILDPNSSSFDVDKKFCYPKRSDTDPTDLNVYKRIGALLKLSKPIPLGQSPHNYSAIKIAQPNEVNWVSSKVKVGGWETFDNGSVSVQMLRAPLHIMKRKDCQDDKFGGVWMCSNGSNICSQDWGAPAIARADGGDRLIGISFLSDCKTNILTLNVTTILPWINRVMREEEPRFECIKVYEQDFLVGANATGGSQTLKVSKAFHFLILICIKLIIFLQYDEYNWA